MRNASAYRMRFRRCCRKQRREQTTTRPACLALALPLADPSSRRPSRRKPRLDCYDSMLLNQFAQGTEADEPDTSKPPHKMTQNPGSASGVEKVLEIAEFSRC